MPELRGVSVQQAIKHIHTTAFTMGGEMRMRVSILHFVFVVVLLQTMLLNGCAPDVIGPVESLDNVSGSHALLNDGVSSKTVNTVDVASGSGWIVPVEQNSRHSITFNFRLELRDGSPHLNLSYVDRDPPATSTDEDPDGFMITAKEGENIFACALDDGTISIALPVDKKPVRRKGSRFAALQTLALITIRDHGKGKDQVEPDEFELVLPFDIYFSSKAVGSGNVTVKAPDVLTRCPFSPSTASF